MNRKPNCGKQSVKTSRLVCLLLLIAMFATAPPRCLAEPAASGQTSAKEIGQQTEDLLQSLKSYTAQQKDVAVEKARESLQALDKHIDGVEKKIDCEWDKMDDAARDQATATLRTLREQRLQVAEWYGSLKNSSADAWDRMKKGFSDAYTTLDDSWQKALKEYGTKE